MSILAKILADKEPEVAAARAKRSLGELRRAATEVDSARSFEGALRRAPGQDLRVIAEFKRASPSAGAIAAGVQPEDIAPLYEEGGAAAISVLTDQNYFDGRLEFLGRVKACTKLPVLRKDFIISEYQVVEAKVHGADALLLIVAALEKTQLAELYACTRELGLQALVEVHSEDEALVAADIGAEIIGVNHRDLATFEIDRSLTGRLSGLMPGDTILVGESGIRGAEDMQRLASGGAHAVLIGETLMRAEKADEALKELRGER